MSSPSEHVRSRLKELIHELSGYPVEEVLDKSTFFELGFDSLFLTQLATAFQNEFGVKITFRQLFGEIPSVEAVSEYLVSALPEDHAVFASNAQLAEDATPPVRVEMPSPGDIGDLTNAPDFARRMIAEQLQLMSRQLDVLAGRAPAAAAPAVPTSAPTAPSASSEAAESGPPELPAGFGPSIRRDADELTPRERAHLERLVARYTERTAGSRERTQRFRAVHADPRTAAGFDPLWKEMVYPIWVERSSGAHLWDVDGNEYIDLLNGFGPNFLGHSPPFVTEALRAQLERGIEVGPQTPLAGEAAELFCELTGMDRVSFVNTGSEAVQAAMRLARTVTGRDRIVVFRKDYHGNFDEVLIRGIQPGGDPRSVPLAPGIPMSAVGNIVPLDYGTDEALEWIRAHADQLAAVLVEPVQSRRPEWQPREFLREIRRITEAADSVLIFDEVITGFRDGPGGAQAMFGVEADLATYGKVLGGGMPIGAVAGRRRFMDTFDGGMWQYGDDSFPEAGVTFFAGTFVRHPMAVAAAHAVLTYLGSQPPSFWEVVNRRTERLVVGMNERFQDAGVQIEVPHCCSQMFIRVRESRRLATLLFYHLRLRGIHLLEGFPSYMTVAHTDEDVDAVLERLGSSLDEMTEDGLFGESSGANGSDRPSVYALSHGQRELWMASQVDPVAASAYNESDTLEFRGPLDVDTLRSALGHVVDRHAAFRTVFDGDGSSQRVVGEVDIPVEFLDLSESDEASAEEAWTARLRELATEPFDLESGPLVRIFLVRFADDHHRLAFYGHHLVYDGWSADVLFRDLAATYNALRTGAEPELEPAASYADYVDSEHAYCASEEGSEGEAFWRERLGALPGPVDLPTDRPRASQRTYRGHTVHASLEPRRATAVREAARSVGVTPHAFLFAAFAVLLSKLSGERDLVLGVPAAGQAASGFDALVGYGVNLLPIRCAFDGETAFGDLARSLGMEVLEAFEHQRVDVASVARDVIVTRDPSRLATNEIIFNYSRYLHDLEFDGLEVSPFENPRTSIVHDLFFNVVEAEDELVVDWDHNTDLFDRETILSWVGFYDVVVGTATRDPSVPIRAIALMTDVSQGVPSDG